MNCDFGTHWNGTGVASQSGTSPQRQDQSVAHDAFICPCEACREEQLGMSGSVPGDTFAINCRMTNNVSLHTPSQQPEVTLNINLVKKCNRADISIKKGRAIQQSMARS